MQYHNKRDAGFSKTDQTVAFHIFSILLFILLLASCSSGESSPASTDSDSLDDSVAAPAPGDDELSTNAPPESGQASSVGNLVPDTPDSTYYATNPASSVLFGAVIGDSTYTGEEQSRLVPFQIDVVNASVTLESVTAVRSDLFGEQSTTLVMTIYNGTDQPRCSVSTEQGTMIDVEGNTHLSILPFSTMVGTAYGREGSDLTVQCVPPGERAYMVTSFEVEFERAAQFSAESLEDRDAAGATNASIAVVPTQYALSSRGRLLNVTIQNQSTDSVDLRSLLSVILDATGRPVFAAFSYFTQNLSGDMGIELAPGGETTDAVVIVGFRGDGSNVRIVVNGKRVP